MNRSRRTQDGNMPMDSMLDILSNVVGMLIFIIIVAVFCSQGMKIVLNSFLRLPKASKPVYFVCRSGTITNIDPTTAVNQFHELQKEMESTTIQEVLWESNRRELGSDLNYHVEFIREVQVNKPKSSASIGLRYYSKGKQKGQLKEKLDQPDEEYANILQKATNKSLFYFYVYPDAVDIFDAARKLASDKNFEVGWRPMLEHQTVGFSGFAAKLLISQ